MENNLKILLTGGHAHATAYALIKELKKKKGIKLYWVGPKSLVEGKKFVGVEEKVFTDLGVEIYHINAGRLQMKLTKFTLSSMLRIPLGFIQAFMVLAKVKPGVVVSFGGFVGLPVVFSSWLLRIPVILHEQTTVAGRGNIYAVKFAKKIAISRIDSKKYYPPQKTVLIGNPIDEKILEIKKTGKGERPVVFITGGHTGSKSINEVVEKSIYKLLKKYTVIHQVGLDYDRFVELKSHLNPRLQNFYRVYKNIESQDWPGVLKESDVVVSRAGANSTSQFMAIRIPSLLIPIPHTYLNEQNKNADYAVSFGIAKKLNQDDLSPETLITGIDFLYDQKDTIYQNIKNKKSPDLHAAENFAKLIFNEAKTKNTRFE